MGTKLLSYRGYSARVEFSPQDGVFVGRVLGVKDIISFEGSTVAGLVEDFHNAVDHYLAICEKRGERPDKPFSGTMMVRGSPDLHAKAVLAAEAAGLSFNQWAARVIERAVSRARASETES